jgi:murein DD-endopeptidase MepM/ murein hydrolase activator NlpD
MRVGRGDLIGYVGSTGNADPRVPHLHFAVFELEADKKWWHGKAINPYSALLAAAKNDK